METITNIFKEHLNQYLKANKQGKSKILKHVCFVTKMHAKSSIRKFRRLQLKDPYKVERRGRHEYYGSDVTVALKEVWGAGNEVCGELLFGNINEYVTIFKRDNVWKYGDETTGKLLAMKLATVKRRCGEFIKARRNKKGISATRPNNLKSIVKTFSGPWKELPPGNGQIDTVLHKDTVLGDAVYTLNYTDSATCMVIPRAQWNKGQGATLASIKYIEKYMYFPWLLAHPDSGSEFINFLAYDWFKENNIKYVRSRSGRKNDNMYVEERNGHVVRKMVGYINLDCIEVVDYLNRYYDVMTPYLIHFVAVKRMISKEKDNSKYKRVYEKNPKTPYQRIMEHPNVTDEVKEKLRLEHSKLNPMFMKKEMAKRLKKVYDIQRQFGKS